jgi:hypothetical protein
VRAQGPISDRRSNSQLCCKFATAAGKRRVPEPLSLTGPLVSNIMTAKAAGLALPPEYNWIFGYEYSGYVLAG